MAHVLDTGIVRSVKQILITPWFKIIISKLILILCSHDEIGMVFVYAVIAQMDTRIIETVLIGRVLDSGKTNQSVSIQINDQWVIRRDGHVKPKIALVPVYQ